jgi:glycosyltransferase involved in cell wall biosynthesis
MRSITAAFADETLPLVATAVIVLYRTAPNESESVRTLLEARRRLPRSAGRLDILVWDNSPEGQRGDSIPEDVCYVHDARNAGLANAYNRAFEFASEHQSEWLITLDQDTTLPGDYLLKMAEAARLSTGYSGIGAVVPQVVSDETPLSPNIFLLGAVPYWYGRGTSGVFKGPVFAFNSAAMIRMDALRQVGGYAPWFWLDNSDTQLFKELHRHGKRVYIAGTTQVQHEFSLKNIKQRMSAERYKHALLAESAFWDLNMNRLAGCERTARLLLRLVKQWLRGDPSELRQITRNAALARLSTSRVKRIDSWKDSVRQRLGRSLVSSSLPARRMKVSVCMAAYNGERYIEAQLKSIVRQLKDDDEVVIVDDCSRDATCKRIVELNDVRIRLLRHAKNLGVVRTFEDALRSATGDILFLCDDDDLWAESKVERFLEEFDKDANAQIVISRARLIDEAGAYLADGRWNREGKFVAGFWRNVMMNHYQGSAMALRASLLGQVLPLPDRCSFMHDAWIGTRNAWLGGKTVFIDDDLLLYRRHAQNATRPKSLLQKIRGRLDLLIAHVSYALHQTAR